MNVVLGWWWLNTLLEARPPSEAGPIVGGGVSIAVRSVYLGKQVCTLSFEVLQEAKKTAGKVVRRAENFVGHE